MSTDRPEPIRVTKILVLIQCNNAFTLCVAYNLNPHDYTISCLSPVDYPIRT